MSTHPSGLEPRQNAPQRFPTLSNQCSPRRWRSYLCKISPQDRLAACPADKKLPVCFQGVLQGVRFVAVGRDPCRKRKIFGFDGVVAMIDTEVHVFNIPFVKMWNTLPAGKRNVPFPAGKFWGYRGESVREGKRGIPGKRKSRDLKKGRTSPWNFAPLKHALLLTPRPQSILRYRWNGATSCAVIERIFSFRRLAF